jgi:hypothetical protein
MRRRGSSHASARSNHAVNALGGQPAEESPKSQVRRKTLVPHAALDKRQAIEIRRNAVAEKNKMPDRRTPREAVVASNGHPLCDFSGSGCAIERLKVGRKSEPQFRKEVGDFPLLQRCPQDLHLRIAYDKHVGDGPLAWAWPAQLRFS